MIQFVKRDDIFFPECSVFGSFSLLFNHPLKKRERWSASVSLLQSARCCATSNMLAAQVWQSWPEGAAA